MADATRVYWLERGQIAIATSNDYFNTFTSPTEAKTVRVYCVKRANHFAITSDIDYTQTTDLHDDFHNAGSCGSAPYCRDRRVIPWSAFH